MIAQWLGGLSCTGLTWIQSPEPHIEPARIKFWIIAEPGVTPERFAVCPAPQKNQNDLQNISTYLQVLEPFYIFTFFIMVICKASRHLNYKHDYIISSGLSGPIVNFMFSFFGEPLICYHMTIPIFIVINNECGFHILYMLTNTCYFIVFKREIDMLEVIR